MVEVHNDADTKRLVQSWVRGKAGHESDTVVISEDLEVRSSRLGLGAVAVVPSLVSTGKLERKLLGSKRKAHQDTELTLPNLDSGSSKSGTIADEPEDPSESRTSVIKQKVIKAAVGMLPKSKKLVKPPPPSLNSITFNSLTVAPILASNIAATVSKQATDIIEAALISSSATETSAVIEVANKKKKYLTKKRSRQKNLRKDNRPDHLKPNYQQDAVKLPTDKTLKRHHDQIAFIGKCQPASTTSSALDVASTIVPPKKQSKHSHSVIQPTDTTVVGIVHPILAKNVPKSLFFEDRLADESIQNRLQKHLQRVSLITTALAKPSKPVHNIISSKKFAGTSTSRKDTTISKLVAKSSDVVDSAFISNWVE